MLAVRMTWTASTTLLLILLLPILLLLLLLQAPSVSGAFTVTPQLQQQQQKGQRPRQRQPSSRITPSLSWLSWSLNAATKMPHAEDKMPFYALGTNLALQADDCVPFTNLKSVLEPEELDVVIDAFCTLFRTTSGRNRDKKLDDERMGAILNTFGPQFNVILNQRMGRISETIQKEGQAFVTRYCQEHPTVVVTDSGLVYHEVVAGTGKSPTLDSTVEVHYHGTLTDGTIVDSSVVRDETATFPLNAVIPGWTEGLQRMKEGGERNNEKWSVSNRIEHRIESPGSSSPCRPVTHLWRSCMFLLLFGFFFYPFIRSSHVDPSVRLGLWNGGFWWRDSTWSYTSI
jgi:hypothetical protein